MKTPHYSMSYFISSDKIRISLEFQTNGYVGIGFGSEKMEKEKDEYHTSCYMMFSQSNENGNGKIVNGYCEGGKFIPLPTDNSASLLSYEEYESTNSNYFPKIRKFVFERLLSPKGHYPIVVSKDVPMIWFTGRNDTITEPSYFERGLVFNFEKGIKISFGNKLLGWIGLVMIGFFMTLY